MLAATAKPAWEPDGELPKNPRDFKTPNYGLTTFASLFTPRQLVALTTFSDLVSEAKAKVAQDALTAGMIDDGASLYAGAAGTIAYAGCGCDEGQALVRWILDGITAEQMQAVADAVRRVKPGETVTWSPINLHFDYAAVVHATLQNGCVSLRNVSGALLQPTLANHFERAFLRTGRSLSLASR